MEHTLSIIKPDAVKRNLIGEINSMIENSGIKIVAQRMMTLSLNDAENFYGVHKDRAFFKDLCEYMISGQLLFKFLKATKSFKHRDLMGTTNPSNVKKIQLEKNSVYLLRKTQFMDLIVRKMLKLRLNSFFLKERSFLKLNSNKKIP